jgi:hypothetical protein
VSLPAGRLASRVSLHASRSARLLLAWVEHGEGELDRWKSRVVVVRFEPGRLGATAWSAIHSPLFDDYGPVSLAERNAAGGHLAVWSGRSLTTGYEIVYGARVDCVPEAPAGVVYEAAWGPPTALDRMWLIQRDRARDVCFQIGLAHPSDSRYSVTLPAKWAIEYAVAQRGAGACTGARPLDAIEALGATGVIDWPGSLEEIWPICELEASVSLRFAPDLPWLSESELVASSVGLVGPGCE